MRTRAAASAPSPDHVRRKSPNIAAWITAQVLLELDRRGVPAEAALARHGLDRALLTDLDATVPLAVHAAFYRDAAVAAGDQALAVGVGLRAHLGSQRVLGHCLAVAATLGEAYRTFGRYLGLISDAGVDLSAVQDDRFDTLVIRRRHQLEVLDDTVSKVTSLAQFAESAPVRPCRPVEVVFDFAEPPFAGALREALRLPLQFDRDQTELRFAPGAFETPIAHADPALHAELDALAARELAKRPEEPAGTRVRAAVLSLGFEASRTVTSVARSLGISGRTLQRQLSEERTSFRAVRDEVLRERALELLRQEGATVEEAAFKLGFASRTAFHRAVRRWTGSTPGQARKADRAAPSP